MTHPTIGTVAMGDKNMEILIRDLRQYASKPVGSIRIDMNDVRSILAVYDAALSARPAQEPVAVPDGWQLVPIKADVGMIGAWYRYKNGHRFAGEEPARDTSDVGAWAALLAAAPVPPQRLTELDNMVTSAIEAAIETSPEFNHGWRSMPDKALIPEILDEIPIEYTEKDVAEAIYRYKVRRLTGDAAPQPVLSQPEVKADDVKARVLGALDDFAGMQPEDDEDWESWYHAAFDLARDKVSKLLSALCPLSDIPAQAGEVATDNRHEFAPNKKYPWFCAHCGYAPHEPLMHLQPAATASEGSTDE